MEKLLTIVIPSYNMEKYLTKCLESVLVEDKELLDLLDVIVVNDGSKDGTSAIGHRYAVRHPNSVRVVDKENGHHGSCVNCGLKMAKGRFIRILDADDYFDKAAFTRYLRKLIAICEDNRRIDAVVTPYRQVRPDGSVICSAKCDLPENEILDDGCILTLARTVCLTSLTYSIDMLRGIGYRQTEEIEYSDTEWAFSPFAVIKSCVYVNEFVYCYLIGREGQSISKAERIKNFDSVKKLLSNTTQLYKDIKMDSRFDKTIVTERMILILRSTLLSIISYFPIGVIRSEVHDVLGIMRESSPELETAAMSTSVSRIFAFNYVNFIENHPRLYLPYVVVLRAYLTIARFYSRIASRISQWVSDTVSTAEVDYAEPFNERMGC